MDNKRLQAGRPYKRRSRLHNQPDRSRPQTVKQKGGESPSLPLLRKGGTMKAYKVTFSEMKEAINMLNAKYENNIQFNRFEHMGDYFIFTLRVKDTKKAGHRLGFPHPETGKQKRLSSACWHVHGDFFDCLLSLNKEAVIKSTMKGQPLVITAEGGNWQDANIGSIMQPLYYSEACECDSLNPQLTP